MTSVLHPLYFALFPQGAKVTDRAHGLDVSKYDKYFEPETATSQLDFVIQRISYRTTRDEAFEKLLPGVMSVPIRGGYHYLNSDRTWRDQADAYLRFIDGYEYHFHACDFESAFNSLSLDFAYAAWQWIHYVQDRTGRRVLLYTSPSHYHTHIYPSQARFGIDWNTVDLWQAQWFTIPNPDGKPSNPTSRTAGWKLWQYTDKGHGPSYGVSRPTACDLNVFNGSVSALASYVGAGAPPVEPPPTGGTMYKGRTNQVAKLWREPGVNQFDQLPSGVDVTGDAPQGDYVYLRTPKAGWTKKAFLSNYVLVVTPPPSDPPPPAEDDYFVHHRADGTTKKYVPE